MAGCARRAVSGSGAMVNGRSRRRGCRLGREGGEGAERRRRDDRVGGSAAFLREPSTPRRTDGDRSARGRVADPAGTRRSGVGAGSRPARSSSERAPRSRRCPGTIAGRCRPGGFALGLAVLGQLRSPPRRRPGPACPPRPPRPDDAAPSASRAWRTPPGACRSRAGRGRPGRSSRRSPRSARRTLLDDMRDEPAVVEMGVGQEDRVQLARVVRERDPVADRLVRAALEHPAVDQDPGALGGQQELRAGHRRRGPEELEVHRAECATAPADSPIADQWAARHGPSCRIGPARIWSASWRPTRS